MKKTRLRTKFVSFMMAGVMAFSSVVMADASFVTAWATEERAAGYEEIAIGSNLERSSRLAMTGDQAVITVEAVMGGSFRTSVVDGEKYITTVTDGQSWYAAAEGSTIYYEKGTAGDNVIQGHIYEVRYTRSGSNYTIEYYDVSKQASLYTFHANNTNLTGSEVVVYAKVVEGKYRVYNCSAQQAGFKGGDYSEFMSQTENHGRDRSRRVEKPDNTIPDGYDVNPATQGSAKDGAYDKYFLKDSLQEVRITMKADNLDYILQNAYYKETALAESATVGGQTVRNVGLKVKGNYTRYMTDEAGNDRFSFTINFGKYVKKKYGYTETQNFFGCQKISFNNFNFDKTMMKEYNALRLMTEMGIPTPQYGLAKLYINDEYYGVYFMLEAMDSSILEQYYNTSSKNLSDFLTKPSYYSPRFYPWDFEDCIGDGVITWDELVDYGYIIDNGNGTYSFDKGLQYYSGLWENDDETFQDVVKELPTVLTWLYRITMLSNGKDFQGENINVNSQEYLDMLKQVIDVDETVRYFAAHSFLLQMDNLFTNRQNYGLYVNKTGQSVMVPWDYDLAWGCYGAPADGESAANWDIDKLYNDMMAHAYHYTDDLGSYYGGSAASEYMDQNWNNMGSGYPLFNVIYQNQSLMEKFHTYMEDCSKIASLGGSTSMGNYYEAGRFGATIDSLRDEIETAAADPLPENIFYQQYDQPNDVKHGLTGLKQMIALRSVGVWLQVNGIDAKVTGYGYKTNSLGNDAESAKYTTGGSKIAVVDDTTGIFTVADYAEAGAGPELTATILQKDSAEYQAVEASLPEGAPKPTTLTVYSLKTTKDATSSYDVYLPVPSKDAVVYSCSADGKLQVLEATTYDDCMKKVTVSALFELAVADTGYQAQFNTDDGVSSIDVYYTHDYTAPSEEDVTSAVARNDLTGTSDKSGDGQINFRVNLKDGYKIKSVKADKNYKNVKTPADTEEKNVYRVTKIKGDLVITVETVQAEQYDVTFKKDDGVASIDVYSAQDAAEPDEQNVTKTIVRNKKGEPDMSGDGQVNFRVNLQEGRMIDAITISGGYYKNIKLPIETGIENVYRVTKIFGDVEIKVTTKEKVSQYDAAFVKDDGVSSIDIYYTQDYTSPNETDVDKASARSSATGDVDVSGAGQINFRVNLKEGYVVKSVEATDEANYKNLKGSEETGVENIYRITKITGNLTVTIATEKKQESPLPTEGLIGYYGFEDSIKNTAFKDSGAAKLHSGAKLENGNWDKAAAGQASYSDGKIGKAYSFTGDVNGASGDGLELDVKMPEAFTIAYWVKPDTVKFATSMVFSPIDPDNGLNIADNWGMDDAFPTVRAWGSKVQLEGADGEYLDNWHQEVGPSAYLGEWTHIALTCDTAGNLTLYANGVRKGTVKIKPAAFKNCPIYLGINYWDPTFDGLMDEVYVYDKALTAADVRAVYQYTKNFEPTKNKPASSTDDNNKPTTTPKENKVTVKTSSYSLTASAKKTQTVSITASATGGNITYKSDNKKVTVNTSGKVTIPKNFAGTVRITVQSKKTGYKDASATVTVKVAKIKQTFKGAVTKVKKKRSKKAQSFSIGAKASGKVTYSVVKKDKKKVLSVKKNGKVTIKKKAKKGTYTIKVKATAAAKGIYNKTAKTYTIKVTIK